MSRTCLLTVIAVFVLLLNACGGLGAKLDSAPAVPDGSTSHPSLPDSSFPTQLPQDGQQPWESGERSAAAINAGSEFTAGRDWYSSSPEGVSENGEAARITSPAGSTAWGIWRIPLGGAQPGTLSADVNLLDDGSGVASQYYIGVANYGSGHWDFHGPFSDSHVRLSPAEQIAAGGNFLSSVQNTFICVLASNGSSIDVVGLGLNPFDGADSTAPAQPTGLTAAPVSGGLELTWTAVIASDLAGYRIYYSDKSFLSPASAGVKQLDYLEGSTRTLLSGLSKKTYVRITALDHSGNESLPGDMLSATPLTGSAPGMIVTTDLVSGTLGNIAKLTLSGAEDYSIDTNGDGVFDISGNTGGTVSIDTSATGIIRPRVRGSSRKGEAVALGAVSLIITGNSRPLASATASPQSGQAPLDVTFTGIAEDAEDDASALTYAWDFDGDGIYETGTDTLTPPVQNYASAGLFNAKFRVTDSEGSSDVDTVPVLVTDPDAPANQQPTAALQVDIAEGDAPLAVNFDASGSSDSDGNIVDYAWDWDGDGIYDGLTDTPNTSHTFTDPGFVFVNLRIEDNQGGRAIINIGISVTVLGNNPPVADLQVDNTEPDTGEVVTFDALASSDAEGSIAGYAWDFDDDGLFDETDNGESAANGLGRVKLDWALPAFQIVSVRVTDEDAAQDTASVKIAVNGWGTPQTLDSTGDMGRFTSLAIVDGSPAISYHDASNGDLRYVRATDPSGSAWDTPQTVDGAGNTGWYTCLTMVNGNPAISYFDQTNDDLRYVRAADPTGTSWDTPQTTDSAGNTGWFTSLVVANGNPAISYYDQTNRDLRYVRASDPSGTAWNTPQIVDGAGDKGWYSSMAVVNGNPAISYYDGDNLDLLYVRATDSSGTSWDTPQTPDSTGNVGLDTSLAMVNGNPAISYRNGDSGDLRYVRATDPGGSAWDTPQTVDSAGNTGWYTSLAMVYGNPAISYHDASTGNLRYVRSLNPAGSAWNTPQTLAYVSGLSLNTSLAVVNGNPAISYYDGSNNDQKFIRFEP